ncbi:MAG: hypothetical protein ACOX6P_01905 [Candidatus Merdivicinus sp.]
MQNQTEEVLSQLLAAARKDSGLRSRLLATRQAKDPLDSFCKEAKMAGFPITVGELVAIGEEYSSNLLKSVNGGAEYPMEGWDDAYEMFLAALF